MLLVLFGYGATFFQNFVFISMLILFLLSLYEGKSLNNRNAILKCMKNDALGKILFWDTKWLLSNMSYRGSWLSSSLSLRSRPYNMAAPPWTVLRRRVTKRYSFFVVRGCETLWNLQKNDGSVWRQLFESGESVWMGGKIPKLTTKCQWWTPEWNS